MCQSVHGMLTQMYDIDMTWYDVTFVPIASELKDIITHGYTCSIVAQEYSSRMAYVVLHGRVGNISKALPNMQTLLNKHVQAK